MIEKIKTFFKEEWKALIFIALLYFGLSYEFPYVIYTPGGHINMSERVDGDNMYDETGSLSMTYVSMVKGTIPFILLSKVVPNWDLVSVATISYEDEDFDSTVEIDKIYMQEAISNAEYVAYRAAGIDFEETATHNIVTYVSSDAKTNLKYGDEILTVDGSEYTNLSEFQNYISAKKPGDVVRIEYKRGEEKYVDSATLIEIDGLAKVGLSIATISDYETDYNISIETKDSESGPSGGFITALAIYNRITPYDITKGKIIMGTGTIDKDGTVGEIGGVKYKLLGAYKDGADIFLCPKENYEEALEVKNEEDMDITLMSVSNFDEALKILYDLK